ncbi:DUF1579 family protein [Pontibacter litorisediminis]|uniref:DUF1579 family protein n=1 Tax=Pontibacter litorisediminis TaxID=1846260 RepID=UPI0023EB936F|nr:DUF1579 family protein [Pontibacter litorisediminis]
MKKVIFTLLAAALLVAAAPAVQAQELREGQLTSKEAYELLRRLSGNWLVSHYTWQPESRTFHQTTGEAQISHAYQGSFLHEKADLKLPDGSKKRQECFLGYSAEKSRFELIQADEKSRNTTLMVGKWYPECNAITLTHPDGLKKGVLSSIEYVYVFLSDNALLKIVRTLDKDGNLLILSKDYYTPRQTASR